MNPEQEEENLVALNFASSQQPVPKEVQCIQVLPSVTEIPDRAFADCSNLQEVRFSVASDSGKTTSRVQRIGHCAFQNCTSLTEVILPDSVQVVGNAAWEGCTHLKIVQLSNQLTQLGDRAFARCPALRSISLPNSVTHVGSEAFALCTQLKHVELSNALEELAFGVFPMCLDLQTIAIPPSVKTIGNNAFTDNYSLVEVHLSEGLRKIDADAFHQCRSLLTIRIPSTVLKIGMAAFDKCSSLQTVEFANGNLQVLNALAFASCTNLFHLALPDSIHTHYPNTFSRCDFKNTLEGCSLSSRFGDLPVHKLLYLQVHQPLSEALEAIQALDEESFADDKYLEFRGMMTPFHILAASSRPDPLLFEIIMSKYPQHLWNRQDASKTTAMSYLLGNHASESSTAIQHVMNSVLQDRIAFRFHDWSIRLQDMMDATALAQVSERKRLFEDTIQTVRKMERTENSSSLELAVWKMKIAKTTFCSDAEVNDDSLRESCRIGCGAEIVIPNVFSYLSFDNSVAIFGQ